MERQVGAFRARIDDVNDIVKLDKFYMSASRGRLLAYGKPLDEIGYPITRHGKLIT